MGGRLLFGIWLSGMLAAAPVEFNRDIRPILSDRCFACHGPDSGNRKAGLRLDTPEGATQVLAKERRAIVPGDLAHSGLYQRVTSANKGMRMPPAYAGHAALPVGQIALLKQWIEEGAKWESHWSFAVPRRAALPEVKDAQWARNPIDRFVLARLEKEGLRPSAEVDRATLMRRVTLDITGLPPTPAEVQAFLADTRADAYERMVDRLLASPRYAERMTYRWLEAARYADTNGYQMDGPRDMWRWRDWVLEAFQHNKPFDQFTVEQIAGDLLPHATLSQKIATAFHRNHRTNAEGGIVPEEFRVEYVVDRVDTTGTVWMGLTMGCARCHDHKYDPIRQRDYYSMFAFFNNVPEKGLVYNFGNEDPYLKAPTKEQEQRLAELNAGVAAAEQKLKVLGPEMARKQTPWEKKIARGPVVDGALSEGLIVHAALEGTGEKVAGCAMPCTVPVVAGRVGQARAFAGKGFIEYPKSTVKLDHTDPFTFAAWIKPDAAKGAILSAAEDDWEGQGHGLYLVDGKLRLHVIFRWTDIGMRVETVNPVKLHEWQHVAVTYDGKRKGSGVRMYVDGQPQELKILFDDLSWTMDLKLPFRVGAGAGLGFFGAIDEVRVYNRALSASEAATLAVAEPVSELAKLPVNQRAPAQADKLRLNYLSEFAPKEVQRAQLELKQARAERDRYEKAIPTVMVMQEGPVRPAFVLKRGAYDAPGEPVSPSVPGFLPPMDPTLPRNRLGLAQWLVSKDNPLTSRATVNRFWQMLFGVGLVKTTEDFGAQGEWPVHRELLDWLAVEFVESGWDVQKLLRTIVTSATYRQSSKVTPELVQRDPENRLYARGARLRLSAEMVRDQALAVSGLLVEKVGGPSVKPYQPLGLWQELHGGKGYVQDQGEGLYRRSLYTYWKRTVAPPSMVNFDSPSRETCTVREGRTNTPLQALTLMNEVTYLEAARKLGERVLKEGGGSPQGRLGYLYRLVLARAPRTGEQQTLEETLARFREYYGAHPEEAESYLRMGDSARDGSLPVPELAAYTAMASLALNLDETITKE